MTTLELLEYYSSLLIFQYLNKPKATGFINTIVQGIIIPQTSTQQIAFSATPSSGNYTLTYNGNTTSELGFNATDSDIQIALRLLPGLSAVTVLNLLVTFIGVIPPALSLSTTSNLLTSGGVPVIIGITETDVVLPLSVQNGYNLIGPNLAQGVQLDVIGKYAGVTRSGVGTSGQPITLDDSDFLMLINMAIITNNAGSSFYTITNLIYQFFGTEIFVTDSTEMSLTYLISNIISSDLLQLFITENLLPAPMGVGVSIIIYAPVVNSFFGFVTYDNPTQPAVTRPFNNYDDNQADWIWFSYSDVLI